MAAGGSLSRLQQSAPPAPARKGLRSKLAAASRTTRDRINKLDVVQFSLRGFLLKFRIRHLSGPKRLSSAPGDVIAISVVRNGTLWIPSFLAHHRKLGVRHFVVLDNGSEDDTREMLASEPDVTLLQTDAPYHAYENTMKRYLAERYCRDRWCLCVDVDELFEYPFQNQAPLSALVAYLDEHKYNAVVTQMLDVFSDIPLNRLESRPGDDLKATFRHYDLSAVRKTGYILGDVEEQIAFHRGGIRNLVFGTDNGLTKVSFFKMDGQLEPFIQWHHVRNGRFADVSCVLLHYPFVSTFYAKVADAVRTGRYGYMTSNEYVRYQARLENADDLHLRQPTSKVYASAEALIDEGFLYASPAYRRTLAGEQADPG